MITTDGIDKIEQFLVDTVGDAQFVSGTSVYLAQSTQVQKISHEDRLVIVASSGLSLPVGVTINEMRLLDKHGNVFLSDNVHLMRTSETTGLYYAFRIKIAQAEG